MGKTVLVTGSTDGLGREVAERLGALSATVIVHGRNAERGAAVVEAVRKQGRGEAVFYAADLASLAEVSALADKVAASHDRLDLLVNNAGIFAGPDEQRRESKDGYELTFAVNYLSHFLLTRKLLPLIERSAPARIVNVASLGQSPIDFDDVMLARVYSGGRAYSQSKLAQIMFTMTLAERLDPRRVTVNSLHPATFMDTHMVRGIGGNPMSTVAEGADAVMQLAVSPALEGRTGLFFNGLKEGRANAQAYDADARRRLWELSAKLTGTEV
ncbi:MAG TPA: SDR family oxidoreductase [Gammaproteobacteria bacterium]|nr:SDR family oxidoreductase [Gammaproteobacteria bacterium]